MMNETSYPFHVDPVVTDQFFGHFSSPGPAGPEKELLIAILADAFECYWKFTKSRKNAEVKLFQEARDWIFAKNEDAPLSFINVCDELRLDPAYLRQRLLDVKSYGFKRSQKKVGGSVSKRTFRAKGRQRSETRKSTRRERRSESKSRARFR